jgi:hypothetical protein
MSKILTFVLFVISLNVSGQTRAEIISTMNKYVEINGKQKNEDFTGEKLNPALHELEKIVCQNGDRSLFEEFLNMILKTTSSANETPGFILGGIFICQPDLVENLFKGKYKDETLNELLKFGFESRTYYKNERPKNYDELRLRVKEIIQ